MLTNDHVVFGGMLCFSAILMVILDSIRYTRHAVQDEQTSEAKAVKLKAIRRVKFGRWTLPFAIAFPSSVEAALLSIRLCCIVELT